MTLHPAVVFLGGLAFVTAYLVYPITLVFVRA